jgi:hypothetical protein
VRAVEKSLKIKNRIGTRIDYDVGRSEVSEAAQKAGWLQSSVSDSYFKKS